MVSFDVGLDGDEKDDDDDDDDDDDVFDSLFAQGITNRSGVNGWKAVKGLLSPLDIVFKVVWWFCGGTVMLRLARLKSSFWQGLDDGVCSSIATLEP
jgi:hypothetical protein